MNNEYSSDPLEQLRAWLDTDVIALATASADGAPSVRMVLLKQADEQGFLFFTSYDGPKGAGAGREPARGDPRPHARPPDQSRGTRSRRAPEAVSDAYWAKRPRGSQIAASVSNAERAGRVARGARATVRGVRLGAPRRDPAAGALGRLPSHPGHATSSGSTGRTASTTGSATAATAARGSSSASSLAPAAADYEPHADRTPRSGATPRSLREDGSLPAAGLRPPNLADAAARPPDQRACSSQPLTDDPRDDARRGRLRMERRERHDVANCSPRGIPRGHPEVVRRE